MRAPMTTTVRSDVFADAGCEVRSDDLTRALYATDASIYQVTPRAVAFPQGPEQAQAAVRRALDEDMAIIPRGAGTGLAGGAVGDGLVIDFSRKNRGITEFDAERRTVRVGPGVVLDQLNAFLAPKGFRFGPDVATSARATLGGMIGNNSSGSHVPVYGVTADHVRSLDIVLADGRLERIGREHPALAAMRGELDALAANAAGAIRADLPPTIKKRWHGYGLDRYLRTPGDLVQLIAGSEGTLAAVASAELDIVPLPKDMGVGLFFFATVAEAMQATVEFLDLQPAAVEHIDDVLFDQTRGQLQFQAARDLLELDTRPCTSILIVEFFEDVDEKLAALASRNIGLRKLITRDKKELGHIWALRKSGLSLLTGCAGRTKPTAGIEDVAVTPQALPEYVRALQKAMADLGLYGSYYGHAATGLLHVRPVVNLRDAGDLAKFRKLGDEVAALVKQYKGSIAGEHGVGIARTEFLPSVMSAETYAAMSGVKAIVDPENRFNPGKIIGDGRYRFDTNLRWGADTDIPLPFTPVLEFAAKDKSFVGNLEQCNGCGGCRKDPPTMCPTYLATGEEIMSTRGRANTIRAVLEGRIDTGGAMLDNPALDEALSNCLSCKACTTECPSNVNMALLKAELLHARHKKHGLTLGERMLGSPDRLAAMASITPGLANWTMKNKAFRKLLRRVAGLSEDRTLPAYASQRFDAWFRKRGASPKGARGTVLLWDDTFTRYNDPHIGRAAVAVLEAARYTVELVTNRACCGRPAFSLGQLDRARALGRRNLAAVAQSDAPIIFLEPSCYSMFAEDYRELGLEGWELAKKRAVLFEHFIDRLLTEAPDAIRFAEGFAWVAIHAHCHAKALTKTDAMARIAKALPNSDVTMLDTGCCGMAGSFGMKADKFQLSVQVAKPLVDQVQALRAGTHVVASGTSCRHQIEALTDAHPVHMAELLAEHLA